MFALRSCVGSGTVKIPRVDFANETLNGTGENGGSRRTTVARVGQVNGTMCGSYGTVQGSSDGAVKKKSTRQVVMGVARRSAERDSPGRGAWLSYARARASDDNFGLPGPGGREERAGGLVKAESFNQHSPGRGCGYDTDSKWAALPKTNCWATQLDWAS